MASAYTHGERRNHIWRAIRGMSAQGLAITPPAIRAQFQGCMPLESIQDYLRALCAAGILDRTEGGYLMVRDSGIEAPRVRADGSVIKTGQAKEKLWLAMRILGTFDVRGLVANIDHEETPISHATAEDYCARLAAAGFLIKLGRGHYRLLPHRAKGPRPIQIRRDKSLLDPNTGTIYSPRGEVQP